MIKIYKRTIKQDKVQITEGINNVKVGSWVNVLKPTSEEIEDVFALCQIDKEKIENSLDEHESPRIEKDNGNLIIYTRVPLKGDQDINTTSITIIINNSFIVTISIRENSVIQRFEDGQVDFYTTQKAKFLINFFSLIVQRFERHIKAISKRVVSKKGKLRYLKNDDIISLVETEEDLNDFIFSLVPNINVFEKILSGRYLKLYEEDQDLIEDLLVDAEQVLDLCKTNIKKIVNIREAYSTIISNNLNKTMKFLAAITVILTVPTIVASIYGMNVNLPLGQNPLAFFFVIGLILLISLGLSIIFVWRRWL